MHDILITLPWACQHWFTSLLDMSIQTLITMPLYLDLLTHDHHSHLELLTPASLTPGIASPHSMDAPWLNSAELSCSDQVRQILLGSRKPSIRATDFAKKKQFSIWSVQQGTSPTPVYTSDIGLSAIPEATGPGSVFHEGSPSSYFCFSPWGARSLGFHQPTV